LALRLVNCDRYFFNSPVAANLSPKVNPGLMRLGAGEDVTEAVVVGNVGVGFAVAGLGGTAFGEDAVAVEGGRGGGSCGGLYFSRSDFFDEVEGEDSSVDWVELEQRSRMYETSERHVCRLLETGGFL
jgi:hypothetical protein